MSEFSLRLQYSVPHCQTTEGVYYALTGNGEKPLCLGSELSLIGGVNAEPDFVALTERVVYRQERRYHSPISHFVLSKLCFFEHPGDKYDAPGTQLEQVANVVISAPGARPFVPVLTEKNFPSIFNIEGVGNSATDDMYSLQTLPAIGDDLSTQIGNKHHLSRYSRESPPQLAIATDGVYIPSYYVLDGAVTALVLRDENQFSLAHKTW